MGKWEGRLDMERWEIALSSRQVGTPRNDKFMVREWVFGAGCGRWERCLILDG